MLNIFYSRVVTGAKGTVSAISQLLLNVPCDFVSMAILMLTGTVRAVISSRDSSLYAHIFFPFVLLSYSNQIHPVATKGSDPSEVKVQDS